MQEQLYLHEKNYENIEIHKNIDMLVKLPIGYTYFNIDPHFTKLQNNE